MNMSFHRVIVVQQHIGCIPGVIAVVNVLDLFCILVNDHIDRDVSVHVVFGKRAANLVQQFIEACHAIVDSRSPEWERRGFQRQSDGITHSTAAWNHEHKPSNYQCGYLPYHCALPSLICPDITCSSSDTSNGFDI